MKFIEITADQFRTYAETSPYQSFMQTPEIGQLRAKNGWTSQYFAVIDDQIVDTSTKFQKTPKSSKTRKASKSPKTSKSSKSDQLPILAATLLVSRPSLFGYRLFCCPGGPLLDFDNEALTDFFLRHLTDYARSHKGYVFRFDPYYELVERDIEGQIVKNGFDHREALDRIHRLGFSSIDFVTHPLYLSALDLHYHDLAELWQQLKHQSRNPLRSIKRAEKNQVKIREIDRSELPVFKQITGSTDERRHFDDRSLAYYQQMYDLFSPRHEIKFLLAEADIDGVTKPLSAAMFMLVGDELIYLFGGSDAAYMRTHCAQYLLQWHMIDYAIRHGYRRYNFYGINRLPEPNSPDYGLFCFKKAFGAHVIEMLGSFELPLNRPIYHLDQFLSKLHKS